MSPKPTHAVNGLARWRGDLGRARAAEPSTTPVGLPFIWGLLAKSRAGSPIGEETGCPAPTAGPSAGTGATPDAGTNATFRPEGSPVDITPSPRILRMLGEIEFDEWQCIAELVDNAFDDFTDLWQSGAPGRAAIRLASPFRPGS